MGAAIAQWIRLRLPSSHPGFESQAYHLCFFQIIYLSFELGCEKNENKQKEAGIGPFKKNFFPLSGFKKTKIWLSRKVLYIKMGQTWPPFVYFRSFHMTKYSTNLTINCKHRWYAWDSNPGRQDSRSIHSLRQTFQLTTELPICRETNPCYPPCGQYTNWHIPSKSRPNYFNCWTIRLMSRLRSSWAF